VLTPEGHYGILRDDQSAHGLVTLAEGDVNFAGYGTTNRIRSECTAGGGRSTLLVLYVDGRKIAQARDRDGPDRFPAIGLTVETSEVGTASFRQRAGSEPSRATAIDVRTGPKNEAETSSEPSPESQGDRDSARSPSKLCKREGIRYSGATAQRGEVCFTVTQDHRRLLEVGSLSCPSIGARRWQLGISTPKARRDRL
jgi:hypothetical protein